MLGGVLGIAWGCLRVLGAQVIVGRVSVDNGRVRQVLGGSQGVRGLRWMLGGVVGVLGFLGRSEGFGGEVRQEGAEGTGGVLGGGLLVFGGGGGCLKVLGLQAGAGEGGGGVEGSHGLRWVVLGVRGGPPCSGVKWVPGVSGDSGLRWVSAGLSPRGGGGGC